MDIPVALVMLLPVKILLDMLCPKSEVQQMSGLKEIIYILTLIHAAFLEVEVGINVIKPRMCSIISTFKKELQVSNSFFRMLV